MSFWDSYNAAYNAGQKRNEDFQAGLDRGVQRKAGNALAGGDYTGAQNALYRNGMLPEARQVGQYQRQQQEVQQADQDRERQRHAEVILKATSAIRQYSQARPGASPIEAFDAVAPALASITDPAKLGQFREAFAKNPDGFLALVEGEAKKALQPVNLGNGGFAAFDPNQADPQRSLTVLREPRQAPIGLDPDKNYFMPESEGPQTAGPSGFAAPVGGGSAPRNQRNNNPGNIEDGPFAKSLPGYRGSDGRFAIFENPQAGGMAAVKLVQSYGQRGFNTVSKIINRWAPSSDNNPTPAYVQFVAQKLGVSPDQPLDLSNPQAAVAVVQAIAQFEGGGGSASNVASEIPGMRQIQQAQPKKTNASRPATTEEKAAYGIPKEVPAQIDANGKLDVISLPSGAAGGTATEGERTAGFLASRLADSLKNMTSLTAKNPKAAKPGFIETVIGNHADQDAADLVRSGDRQAVLSNQLDALDAALTLGTGAAYTKEQIQNYARSYFPQLNDKPEAVMAKRQKFIAILKAAQIKAGRSAPPELAAAIAQAEAQLAGDQKRGGVQVKAGGAKTSGNGWKVVGVR